MKEALIDWLNDPNLWCDEHNQPRYIIDLLKRIDGLSLETMQIVKRLPKQGCENHNLPWAIPLERTSMRRTFLNLLIEL